jgi:hypothetical protein
MIGMPNETFPILGTPEETLVLWRRRLEYLLKNLDSANVPKAMFSNAAASISVVDASSYFVGTNIETVLQEIGLRLSNIST